MNLLRKLFVVIIALGSVSVANADAIRVELTLDLSGFVGDGQSIVEVPNQVTFLGEDPSIDPNDFDAPPTCGADCVFELYVSIVGTEYLFLQDRDEPDRDDLSFVRLTTLFPGTGGSKMLFRSAADVVFTDDVCASAPYERGRTIVSNPPIGDAVVVVPAQTGGCVTGWSITNGLLLGDAEWDGLSLLDRFDPANPGTTTIQGFRTTFSIRTSAVPELVTIDIKPGSDPNSINLKSKGVVPVAVLTTDSFDAVQVDWETVLFGPDGATESHGRSHVKDVDDDGDMDLLLHFNTRDTGIQCSDTEATLTGETFGGEAITGSDAVKIVKCRK